MGISFSVHIGPYVRVPVIAVESVRKAVQCSANCGMKPSNSAAKFCANCGQAIQLVDVRTSVERAPHPSDMAGFEDWMWVPESALLQEQSKGYGLWLPNHVGFGQTLSNDSDHKEVGLSAEDQNKQLAAFMARYQPLLDAAEAQWGIKLEVRFGAVSYYN
jgi:hypothetical protein